jgi:hypothetical protein
MDLLHWVLYGVLPALAAMLLGVGVGGPRWLAIALATALLVPFAVVGGLPAWPWLLDVQSGDPRAWLWWCLCLCGIAGSLLDLRLLPRALLLPLELLAVAMLPWFVSATLRAGWTFEQCVVWLGAGWAVMVASWWVLRRAGEVRPGAAVPLVGALALAVDAVLLRRLGDGLDWHLPGVGAVALGIAVLTTLWRRPFVCGTGAALTIVLAHQGLLWCGRSEGELRSAPLLMAMVVPLPLWLVSARLFANARGAGLGLGLLACGGVAAAAVLG